MDNERIEKERERQREWERQRKNKIELSEKYYGDEDEDEDVYNEKVSFQKKVEEATDVFLVNHNALIYIFVRIAQDFIVFFAKRNNLEEI